MKALELQGVKFNMITVLYVLEGNKTEKRKWVCRCECGKEIILNTSTITAGKQMSCGCDGRKKLAIRRHKHGFVVDGKPIPEYAIWYGIKNRCYNERCREYKYYGARGIKMCDRWLSSVEYFIEDIGLRPSKNYSIERDDTNGDYTPINCRWATRKEQMRNQRSNVWIEYNGKRMIMSDWCRELGVDKRVVNGRIKRGWDAVDAITKPARKIVFSGKYKGQ